MILTMFLPICINILRMLPCLFPGSFVYRFIACSTLGRMQEKFGQTMKKAMSHKMELHTKAHWLPTAAVDTLKIFEVCSCWSHADQRTFKASRCSNLPFCSCTMICSSKSPVTLSQSPSPSNSEVDSYTGDFFFIFRVASLIKGLATVLDIKAQLLGSQRSACATASC